MRDSADFRAAHIGHMKSVGLNSENARVSDTREGLHMATLIQHGVELGELDDFETWVETHQGRFLRRCLFAIPRQLVADAKLGPQSPGLQVKLEDGSTWELEVKRAESSIDLRIHVGSAVLMPVAGARIAAA